MRGVDQQRQCSSTCHRQWCGCETGVWRCAPQCITAHLAVRTGMERMTIHALCFCALSSISALCPIPLAAARCVCCVQNESDLTALPSLEVICPLSFSVPKLTMHLRGRGVPGTLSWWSLIALTLVSSLSMATTARTKPSLSHLCQKSPSEPCDKDQ